MFYYIVLGGAFLTILFSTIVIYHFLFASRLAVMERLKIHTMGPGALQQQFDAARAKGFGGEFLHFSGMLGAMLSRRSNLKAIQQKLLRAHILMRAEEFIGLTIFCGAGLFCVTYLMTANLLIALLVGIVGFKIPGLFVNLKKAKRLNTLTQQLPEALQIVSSGLRAGYSFPQAMSVVSREMGLPIGEEFARVIWENRMGKPLEEVLQNLKERTDSDDLNLFITALLIQKQVGGNLAEILDNISHTVRERVRIKGEIKTLTAQGRLSAVIIILLPIAVAGFLMVMNPEYMLTLVQDTLGIIMLVLAIIMQFLGIIIIQKIINIEV
jgi:tight adherence protein B